MDTRVGRRPRASSSPRKWGYSFTTAWHHVRRSAARCTESKWEASNKRRQLSLSMFDVWCIVDYWLKGVNNIQETQATEKTKTSMEESKKRFCYLRWSPPPRFVKLGSVYTHSPRAQRRSLGWFHKCCAHAIGPFHPSPWGTLILFSVTLHIGILLKKCKKKKLWRKS